MRGCLWNTEKYEDCNNSHHDLGHGHISVGARADGCLGAKEDSVVHKAEDNDWEETGCRERME